MRIKNVCLLIGLLPIILLAQSLSEIKCVYPNKEIVRVISYNIWCGFEYLKDVDRMDKTAEWLKEKDPEVVAFQELCSFNEVKLLKFAKKYGHSYAVIQKEGGYPVGITSKKPIEKIYIHRKNMGHGFMHIKTYGLDMIVLHLTPFNCNNRLKEARIVTNYMKEKQLDSCLVMGDFNSHSPFDAAELETHTELVRSLAVYGEQYKRNNNLRGSLLDYSVQSNFISFPLEDVIRLFVPVKQRMTYPAFTFSNKYKDKDVLLQMGERIDYIYTTPQLMKSCINAAVWNDKETRYFSDHYPIGVDLFLKKEK